MTTHHARLRNAFEQLERMERVILDRILFAGDTCPQIARSLGISSCDVRAAAISAMRALRDPATAVHPATECNDGLLALHALKALDADEADAVAHVVSVNPALERRYLADRELLAAVSTLWPVDPSDHVYRRLMRSIHVAERRA